MNRKQICRGLVLLLVLLAFAGSVACTGSRKGQEETSGDPTQTDPVNERFWLDVLSANGTACRVYYPAGADQETVDAAQLLATYVKAVSGQDTAAEEDSRIPESPGAMILVGQTARPESTGFYASLRYSDYGHAVVKNNVLCVGGYSSANTAKAAKALARLLNQTQLQSEKTQTDGTAETGGYYLSSEQNLHTEGVYPMNSAVLNGYALSDFVLIYEPENGKNVAASLQNLVGLSTGVYLPMKSTDETVETECEILVGNTGRSLTADFYAQSYHTVYNDYQVLISGSKLALVGASEITLECALEVFSDRYLSESDALELTDSSSLSGICPGSKRSIVDRADPSDLRIVSNNVYFYNYSRSRAGLLLESYIYLDADILLLQEVSVDWHVYLDTALPEIGYLQVPTKAEPSLGTVANTQNYTPIFYRADKLTLVECGYDQFESVKSRPDGNLSSSKSFTWALFEEKATGKRFVSISTHYTWAAEETQANRFRTADATEVMAKVAELEAEYACPVIVMGDLNCISNSDPYKVMTGANLIDARFSAAKRENAGLNTLHNLGEEAAMTGAIIDHCFYSKTGLNAVLFQVIQNTYTVRASDHLPIALDFSLI